MLDFLITLVILGLCCVGLGLGVIFFGKPAERTPCGTLPDALKHADCPSRKMGICPVLDKTGIISKLTRFNS
mgnify:CR=1 FL=1